MEKCIICRRNRVEFSDEHVIPDSLGGYYHIYTVCKNCNSNLGSYVDEPLINHKFMEFQRFLNEIRGKKGKIPNPFDGTHHYKDNPDLKVKLLADSGGQLKPYIIPNIPEVKSINENFSIVLDKADEKNIEDILTKICNRNGIPREKVAINKRESVEENNYIEISWSIDLEKFKIGLLKIAYEFATDTIKGYYLHDIYAKTISTILYYAKYEKIQELGLMIGSGIDNRVVETFANVLDFDSNNHYLIIFSERELGLLCFINLFNTFFIGVRLSKKHYNIPGLAIIGINHTLIKRFEKISFNDLMNKIYSTPELRFKYKFSNVQDAKKFEGLQMQPEFDFEKYEGLIPLFDCNGKIKYKNCYEKIKQKHLIKKDLGDFKKEIITNVTLDEVLFIRILPTHELVQVIEINIEQKRNVLL